LASQGHVNLRAVHDDGLAAGVFEQAAGNPLLDEVEFLVRQLVLGRHRRLGGVRGDFVEDGAVRVAAGDDKAGAAAFHHRAVGGEVHVGLGLVGTVALEALVLEEREDVLVVGDFLGGGGGDAQQQSARSQEESGCLHGGLRV
jgi:hypothetical protein